MHVLWMINKQLNRYASCGLHPSVSGAWIDACSGLGIVSCRLDYCNSLPAGVADVHLRRLQSVGTRYRMRQLVWSPPLVVMTTSRRSPRHFIHWLPVRQWVIFNTTVLVWKCLHDAAPRYLADLCAPVPRNIIAGLKIAPPPADFKAK